MTICPRCGSPLAEHQQFCATCGYQVVATASDAAQQAPPSPAMPYAVPPTAPSAPMASPSPSVPYYPPISAQTGVPPMQFYPPAAPLTSPRAPGDTSLDQIFGAAPNPANAHATNAMQKSLQERLPQYAMNPFVGAALGAIVAVITCIVLTFIFTLVLHAVGDQVINQLAGSSAPYLQQFLNSGLLNMVALANHASLTVSASTVATGALSAAASGTIDLPVTLLLLIPAASLMVGGYIAAATDYSNQLRFVLLRAAAMGPLYGILITLIVAIFGTQQISNSGFITSVFSLSASLPSLLLYSIIWGVLFGMLGGLVKLFGRNWRVGTVAYLLSRSRSAVVAGITGALAAVGVGLLLCIPLIFFLIGFSVTKGQFQNSLSLSLSSSTPVGLVLIGTTLLALPAAIWIFSFGSGASINANSFTNFSFISTSTSPTSQTAASIFHLQPNQQYLLLLMVLPAIAYFVGGRVSARVLGIVNPQKQAEAGALMGVFSSVIMFLCAAGGAIGYNASGSVGVGSSFAGGGTGNVGPDLGSSFLGALIFGVVFGALGGYLYRAPQPIQRRASPNPLLLLYDGLTQQPRGVPRQAARVWLYTGITMSVLLGVLAILIGALSGSLLKTLAFTSLQTDISVFGGLLLGLPLLCFAIALMADIASTPPGSEVLVHAVAAPLPVSRPVVAPSAPFPAQYPSVPYTYPQSLYPPATGPYIGQQPSAYPPATGPYTEQQPFGYPPATGPYTGQQTPAYPPAAGPYTGQQPPAMPYPSAQPTYQPGQYPYPAPNSYPVPQLQYPYPVPSPAADQAPQPPQNATPPSPSSDDNANTSL